jgi:DNA-binding ferritin-like protein
MKSRKSKDNGNSKTRKTNYKKTTTVEFIQKTMNFLATIKLYHWTTDLYPVHKSTDKIYEKLQELMDLYVETSLGHYNNKKLIENKIKCVKITNITNKKALHKYTQNYKASLKYIRNKLNDKLESEIINVIDDVLTELDVFLYLLTL